MYLREILHSSKFKAWFLGVCYFWIVVFFAFALSQFRTTDVMPSVKLIDMELRKSSRSFASVVRTGLFIKNFEIFDTDADKFVFGAVAWFEFNADEVMPETIDKFSLVNGKILDKSPGDIRVRDNKMLVKYDFRAEVKSLLTYYRFPFDDHRISIVLTNDYVTPSELYFTVDNPSFTIAEKSLRPTGFHNALIRRGGITTYNLMSMIFPRWCSDP